ncbi:hypothetical protein SLEP1_g18863 [Rubroshorea leprosula]|uniref:Uncharacterized protein n=1 Tax=Rubroshorea leprosula TaxID=152421 RepID=A0AAV5IYX3_9ROSI|nr:hypothetical protein SLEP1_g18863 [Rubroshorea leprosula]
MSAMMQIYDDVHGRVLQHRPDFPIGVLVFPPSIPKEGKDVDSLPSFKAWVVGTPDIEAKPMSVLEESQLALALTHDGVAAPMPLVDLTDD